MSIELEGTNDVSGETRVACRYIANACVERIEALHLKGKAADKEALAFYCGAASLAIATGQTEIASMLSNQAAYIVAIRGMMGVRMMQSHND